jgi:hypothetical protein
MVRLEDSYEEVFQILNHLKIDEYERIPENIVSYYENHRNKNYSFNYDYSKKYDEQSISKDSLKILYRIYYNFILSESEKTKFLEIIRLKEKGKQIKNFSKIDTPNELFKETNKPQEEANKDTQYSKELVEYNTNIFTKIKNFIKKIFHLK